MKLTTTTMAVRPADLPDLRRLLGRHGRPGRQPHLDGVAHQAQVRGLDHPHQPQVGKHHRPLRDLAAAIAELTAKPRGELQVHGSGNLIRWLLQHQLVGRPQYATATPD